MRHLRRMIDERFHASEALRQAEEVRSREKIMSCGRAPFETKRNHTSEITHLFSSHLETGMTLESGKINLLNGGMFRQPVRQLASILAMPVHTYSECLHAAKSQVGIERTGHSAGSVLVKFDWLN